MKRWTRAQRLLLLGSVTLATVGLIFLARGNWWRQLDTNYVEEQKSALGRQQELRMQQIERLERQYRQELLPKREELMKQQRLVMELLHSMSQVQDPAGSPALPFFSSPCADCDDTVEAYKEKARAIQEMIMDLESPAWRENFGDLGEDWRQAIIMLREMKNARAPGGEGKTK